MKVKTLPDVTLPLPRVTSDGPRIQLDKAVQKTDEWMDHRPHFIQRYHKTLQGIGPEVVGTTGQFDSDYIFFVAMPHKRKHSECLNVTNRQFLHSA